MPGRGGCLDPVGGMVSLLAYSTTPRSWRTPASPRLIWLRRLFFTAAVGCLWKMFHKLSPGSFAGGWLALSGLFLSKYVGISHRSHVPWSLLAIRLIGRSFSCRSVGVGGIAVDRPLGFRSVCRCQGPCCFRRPSCSPRFGLPTDFGIRRSAFRFYDRWKLVLAVDQKTVDEDGRFRSGSSNSPWIIT